MTTYSRTAASLLGWFISIPLVPWILSFLDHKRIINPNISEHLFFAHIFLLLFWALWIFGKQFSYCPATIGRALLFIAYVLLLWALAYMGVVLAYFAVVFSFGE